MESPATPAAPVLDGNLDATELPEGQVYRFPGKVQGYRFELARTIGGHAYRFRIDPQAYDIGIFAADFQTAEHGLALTQLSPADAEAVFASVVSMVEAVNAERQIIRELQVRPAKESYTAEEMSAARAKLEASRGEKLGDLSGLVLALLYEAEFGEQFPQERHPGAGGAPRSRLFKQAVRRLAPTWQIREEGDVDFVAVIPEAQA